MTSPTPTTRLSGRIVRRGTIFPGHVELDGPVIRAVIADDRVDPAADFIVPGFVDLHCHGGGGHTFTAGEVESARKAAAFHLTHGTTTLLAGLVSAPIDVLRAANTAYRPLVETGILAGVYLEGPYLSRLRCGAQNPDFLRNPSSTELQELVNPGTVRMVTIAPELPGAIEAITLLRGRGVVAAIGHTDATYAQTLAGIAAGATVGTHVCNGMRPPHHREPGPVIGLLSGAVTCELIADNVHLHPGMLAFAARTAGPERIALITDAIAAAGMPDGRYELGGQAVEVTDRVARLTRDGSLAGSTLTMDVALRNAVHAGIALPDAVTMASTTPAQVLGLADRIGAIEPRLQADLVVLGAGHQVKEVWRRGTR